MSIMQKLVIVTSGGEFEYNGVKLTSPILSPFWMNTMEISKLLAQGFILKEYLKDDNGAGFKTLTLKNYDKINILTSSEYDSKYNNITIPKMPNDGISDNNNIDDIVDDDTSVSIDNNLLIKFVKEVIEARHTNKNLHEAIFNKIKCEGSNINFYSDNHLISSLNIDDILGDKYLIDKCLNNLLGGKKIRYVKQMEYDMLTPSEKQDANIVWNITDSDDNSLGRIKTLEDTTKSLTDNNNDALGRIKTLEDNIKSLTDKIEKLEKPSEPASSEATTSEPAEKTE